MKMAPVKAMIFAAGLGTRFKPWTNAHPKALAVVNGQSLLQRNILYLQSYGIRDVIVNVHHFHEQIIQAVQRNNGWGSNITISDERDEVLETGGGLLQAKELLGRETFITLNVDILTSLDLRKLLAYHKEQAAAITLCTADRATSRFLLFDEDGRLCGWRNTKEGGHIEKIVVQADTLYQKAYSGIAVFEPEVLDNLPFSGKFSLIDVFLHLAPAKSIRSCDHSADKWIDVGRPESVPLAEALFL